MRISVLAAALLAVALLGPGQALAAPPTNDAFADAATLGSIPTSVSVDLTEATVEGGEPGGGCWQPARSAWYAVTPSSDVLARMTTSGPFDRVVNVYRDAGTGIGGLGFIACAYSWNEIVTDLDGGQTYYIQVGAPAFSPGGVVGLDVSVIAPPANDDFADAFTVGPLPYNNGVDNRAATLEPGEPTQPSGASSPLTRTTWYTLTATETGSVQIDALCCGFGRNISVYTGGSVDALTEVPVTRSDLRVIFMATAGTVYRIQDGVATANCCSGISVQRTPMPVADVWWSPGDPSTYDTVAFQANAWDPAGLGIQSYTWDFGDGPSGTGPSQAHRYDADGDFTVSLTVRTPDGRTTTAKRIVSVRTRDVAITKLAVPQSARTNQTKTITVGLANNRAAETVTMSLWRSRVGGGWDLVGQSTQFVPSKSGNKTTSFVFSYTFTPEDATVGKVTFRVVASPNSGRDALPGDNEVIAMPTSVSR